MKRMLYVVLAGLMCLQVSWAEEKSADEKAKSEEKKPTPSVTLSGTFGSRSRSRLVMRGLPNLEANRDIGDGSITQP